MNKELVICPDAGCLGCEHGKPHEFMDVESSCVEGGDNNCPHCEAIAIEDESQNEGPHHPVSQQY
ncbi:hypothetical protein LCGC14_1864470 [marine sediment metagenome]|uniref:Uncharacterized protein n=1 Tax=marine sediment metagenome TaxID=412755 RepID=A0A0F9GUW7_9ZZZZ